ncbi:MAG: isochorismatase family protein [Acetobacteraceae bacterium]|nr:isochorismatase family protein [Acetobacteraceae bacterium]
MRGIEWLIITGTASQVCSATTARDAMMLNDTMFFIADANATFTDEEHNATLSVMAYTFCDVVDAETIVALIGAGALGRAA